MADSILLNDIPAPNMMGTNNLRDSAARAAFYEGEFTLDDLQFRPFTAATKIHMETLNIGEELPEEDDDDAWAEMIIAMAWCQWAPIESVNDLCFAIDEAESAEERERHRRKFRRELLSFKSRLTGPIMIELAKRMTGILSNQQNVSYDTVPKPLDLDPEDKPPGN